MTIDLNGRIWIPELRSLEARGVMLRVFLDGEDVTASCFAAHAGVGYVTLFKRDPHGNVLLGNHDFVQYETKKGRVTYTLNWKDLELEALP